MAALGGPPVVPPASSLPLASGSNAPTIKTFAEVLASTLAPPQVQGYIHAPASTDKGEPAVFFNHEELQASMKPFDFSLVARTMQGRPPFTEIRQHLSKRFKFSDDFVISSLDNRHLLLRFNNYEDYLQLLLRESLYIQGRLFRFFRWSMDFSPNSDPSILPVWISLPGLPVNLFINHMLRSIAGNIGKVLKIDPSTLNLTQTNAARVCLELDISESLPSRVWIGIPGGGFWQEVIYHKVPSYCTSCSRIGHQVVDCKRNNKKAANLPANGADKEPQPKLIWKQISREPHRDKLMSPQLLPDSDKDNASERLTQSVRLDQVMDPSSHKASSAIQGYEDHISSKMIASLDTKSRDELYCLGHEDAIIVQSNKAEDSATEVCREHTIQEPKQPTAPEFPLVHNSETNAEQNCTQSTTEHPMLKPEIISQCQFIADTAKVGNVSAVHDCSLGVRTRSMMRSTSASNIASSSNSS